MSDSTPAELRINLANSQRTAKGRKKWMEMAERVNSHCCWREKAEHDGAKIGDIVKWTDTAFKGDSVHFSMKEAKAFAFGLKSMLVVYRGKLKKINIRQGKDDE